MGNPHMGKSVTPNSIDIAEESGRFFISWSDTPSIVEVWDYSGKLAGQTDASEGGTVYGLDTDGHGGFWDGYYPNEGFAPGIKHFVPSTGDPGSLVEKTDDAILLGEVWGTPYELVCIPDKTLLILTSFNQGKIRAYDISVSPPILKGEITNIFSGELDTRDQSEAVRHGCRLERSVACVLPDCGNGQFEERRMRACES